MMYHPYFFLTDILFYCVLLLLVWPLFRMKNVRFKQQLKAAIFRPQGIISLMVLSIYLLIATLDSIHFEVQKENTYFPTHSIVSLFDIIVTPLGTVDEQTYSLPLATQSFVPEAKLNEAKHFAWNYSPLNLTHQNSAPRLWKLSLASVMFALGIALILAISIQSYVRVKKKTLAAFPWASFYITLILVLSVLVFIGQCIPYYHVLGTDKVGNDILFLCLKSIRTACIIGTITILISTPFAIILGMLAGYYQGMLDDMIQFIYTAISSIPGILLIVASMLSLQVFMDNHSYWFSNMAIKADFRFFLICAILGIMNWTSLCRVLRAETLKLRELEFIQAAKVLGTPARKILFKHMLPNLMHIILISLVLDFSVLVLAEAVLTYIGVGVDPITQSWGNMIDATRMELARDPIIWWPLLSAFSFMLVFILSINVFADVIRDALDPKYTYK